MIEVSEITKAFDQFPHVARKGNLEPHDQMGSRVAKCKKPGMQSLTRKRLDRRFQQLRQTVRLSAEGLAIIGVAEDRVADMGHVDADLVGSAGLKPAFD